jgi:hypothetical protein
VSRKIAPRLSGYVGAASFLGPKECKAELRALLAVARAAQRVADAGSMHGIEGVRLDEALARLDKVSGK